MFTTRLPGDPPGMVRTHGSILSSAHPLVPFRNLEVVKQVEPWAPEGCARDKVALLSTGDGGRSTCHQVSTCRTGVQVVACQNATAAAAVVQTLGMDRAAYDLELELPGRVVVRARGETELHSSGSILVRQVWSGLPFTVQEVRPGPGEARRAVCKGALNTYLLLEILEAQDFERFAVEEADLRWREEFPDGERPLARVAILHHGGGGEARLRFFTCSDREHPSAPPTGLAVLHLARERLGWGPPIDRALSPAGPVPSPATRFESGGTAEVQFAPVLVRLEPT